MGPTGRTSVVQIHPTRRCNLRCRHCYSSSGPERRGELDGERLAELVEDAAREGYGAVSLSGGEPLMFRGHAALLGRAKEVGLATALTTNGTLLDAERARRLSGVCDLVAVSLDGARESHDALRASRGSFDRALRGVAALRAAGVRTGVIFTLTLHNLHELPEVARHALDAGAELLQIHPLELAGRASEGLAGERPDGLEASIAWLEAQRLRAELEGRLRVHVDVVHRGALEDDPERVYAGEREPADAPLGSLLSPLVVEADGWIVPLQYGFDRRHALGRLGDAPLRELGRRWRRERLPAFRALCRRVWRSALEGAGPPCFNWYEAVARAAELDPARVA